MPKTENEISHTPNKTLKNNAKTSSNESANVNTYKHILAVPSANNSYVHWALNLRCQNESKLIRGTGAVSEPPETYYKTIEARKVQLKLFEMKHTCGDLDSRINMSQFEHLVRKRAASEISYSQVKFETTLRTPSINETVEAERERKWISIPKLSRNEEPKFIKSNSLKKKVLQPEEMDSAYDGHQNFPCFTEKIVKQKNINQFRHMMKGRVNLPNISWQVNLRSY